MNTAAVLVAACHYDLQRTPSAAALCDAAQVLRADLELLALRVEGRLVAADPDAPLVIAPDAAALLLAVLDLSTHRPLGSLALGLGYGAVQVDEAERVFAAELSRARRLAWRSRPCSVHCTEAFLGALELPPGVGVHRAPAEAEVRVGFPIHQVDDYRD